MRKPIDSLLLFITLDLDLDPLFDSLTESSRVEVFLVWTVLTCVLKRRKNLNSSRSTSEKGICGKVQI